MITGGDLDELHGHAQTQVRLAYAAFEQCFDAELPADVADVCTRAAELKRRRPGRDTQAIDVCQRVDQLLCETLAQIVLIAAGAHVGEWKDRDGRDVGCRRLAIGDGGDRGFRKLGDEPVPAAVPCFDEARLPSIIRERPAQFLDARRQRVVADDCLGPDGREQVFFRDGLARTRDQHGEHGRRLRREPDFPWTRPEPPRIDIEAVIAEGHAVFHSIPGEIPACSRDFQPFRPVSF